MILDEYAKVITDSINKICTTQRTAIIKAAELVANVILNDGIIYIFGCGHSGILTCEGFYRAGGLACVAPIFIEPLMLHESASESSILEKEPGYAATFTNQYHFESRDLLICCSTSDKNAVPVEYAKYVSDLGIPTIGISSSSYYKCAVVNECGKHLHEVCTLAIDNAAPFGDACILPGENAEKMSPLSSITGVYILNSILAEATRIALETGFDVPIYKSGNIPGGAEWNSALIAKYQKRIKSL